MIFKSLRLPHFKAASSEMIEKGEGMSQEAGRQSKLGMTGLPDVSVCVCISMLSMET